MYTYKWGLMRNLQGDGISHLCFLRWSLSPSIPPCLHLLPIFPHPPFPCTPMSIFLPLFLPLSASLASPSYFPFFPHYLYASLVSLLSPALLRQYSLSFLPHLLNWPLFTSPSLFLSSLNLSLSFPLSKMIPPILSSHLGVVVAVAGTQRTAVLVAGPSGTGSNGGGLVIWNYSYLASLGSPRHLSPKHLRATGAWEPQGATVVAARLLGVAVPVAGLLRAPPTISTLHIH